MKELSRELEIYEQRHGDPNWTDLHPLQVAATKWANHCLTTYDGKLLKKGLEISAALAGFSSALLSINQSVYEDDCKAASPSLESDHE